MYTGGKVNFPEFLPRFLRKFALFSHIFQANFRENERFRFNPSVHKKMRTTTTKLVLMKELDLIPPTPRFWNPEPVFVNV